MAKILVIEDDPDMAMGLRDNLQFEGYEVAQAMEGPGGLKAVFDTKPDLILLDIMLPEMDGFAICQKVREAGLKVPIIMLTARSQELDVVRGLELGADDYITKPFGVRELLARIKAALRRREVRGVSSELLKIGNAEVDLTKGRVRRRGKETPMGHYECEILKMLLARSESPVPRNELLTGIWGTDTFPTDRSVDNHIVSLRRKIEEDPKNPQHILTVHGVGYKFVP